LAKIPEDLVEVGYCAKPHGIKGAFHFVVGNTQDSVLDEGLDIYLFPTGPKSQVSKEGEKHKIAKITFGHKVMVNLEGVNDRNQVEAMIPFSINVSRADFPETDEGEIYITDVIGCKALNIETDEEIGVVHDFYDNGAQIVLKINTKNGIEEVPFVDQFVPEIDIENKIVKVRLLEFV
jgi:16S rRNA processing protein RimM